jgi:hypothetical protein
MTARVHPGRLAFQPGEDRRFSLIQPPDGEVQHSGEAHPNQIGHEKNTGQCRPPPESNRRRCYCSPEQNDVDEGGTRTVKPEEKQRPRRIGDQLDAE